MACFCGNDHDGHVTALQLQPAASLIVKAACGTDGTVTCSVMPSGRQRNIRKRRACDSDAEAEAEDPGSLRCAAHVISCPRASTLIPPESGCLIQGLAQTLLFAEQGAC